MNCFSDELIQCYIDGELTANQAIEAETHIVSCTSCSNKVAHLRNLSDELKKALNTLSNDGIVIPAFDPPVIQQHKDYQLAKKLIYSLSAACVLAFVLFIGHKFKQKNTDSLILYQIEMNIDANKPISDQDYIINIVDPEGNVSELNF